jgi:hypothetical protein
LRWYLCPARGQLFLMAMRMRGWLDEGHLAWFVVDVVGELESGAVHRCPAAVRWRGPQAALAAGEDAVQAAAPRASRANVTDPDSRVMSTKHGWVQGYNAQAIVNTQADRTRVRGQPAHRGRPAVLSRSATSSPSR